MSPLHQPDGRSFPALDRVLEQRRRAAESRLRDLGVHPAPVLAPADVAGLRALDSLLAQAIRAGRHSSGAVRAYASLIEDAYPSCNASRWAEKISRSAGELDAFVGRLATLRACDSERPTAMDWAQTMARVAERCASIGACTIEVTDRARGTFRQRAELMGRMLFHLVRNAVEATPHAGLVRVRIDEMRLDGVQVGHVRVTDCGAGMTRDRLDDAWRPFVTDKRGHAGLGLSYVAAFSPLVGAVAGLRAGDDGTEAHLIAGEQGGLEW